MTTNYRFRVSIQDLTLPDSSLHIFVQHNQPPRYLDLINNIKQQANINVDNYYLAVEKENNYTYAFHDDVGLQNALRSIPNFEELKIRLSRKVVKHNEVNSVPLVKPIFISRPGCMEVDIEEQTYLKSRKDSGISLEEDIENLNKAYHNKPASRKLPALSHIITTPGWSNNGYCLPSPSPSSSKSPIKLPGLSSIITDHNYQQKQLLAPIHAYNPTRFFDQQQEVYQKPLSPPLSILPPYNIPVRNNHKMKRPRASTSQQQQFACEYVIDAVTGKTCLQAFSRPYDLSRHQTIHLKNRPLYYCRDCGKKFTRLDALQRHERIQGHNNK